MNDDLPGDLPSEKPATRTRTAREARKAAEAEGKPEAAAQYGKSANKKAVKANKRKKILRGNAKAVEEQIGHVFTDSKLLTTALTRVSALKKPSDRWSSYQRLE